MRANLLVKPGQIELREIETPSPAEGEVVVKIRAALTCGTDLKTFLRGHPKFPLPTLFGHEFSGEIAQVGRSVRQFREGDKVMSAPSGPCGNCYYCKRNQENMCGVVMDNYTHGAYAEYIRVPAHVVAQNMFEKPNSLSFQEAAVLEPLACVMHGLNLLKLREDDTVVVIGSGAIGLLHLLALKALGLSKIIVLGRRPYRLQIAQDLGAYRTIDFNAGQAREIILDATEGRGADVVVECTGIPSVWESAINIARRGGEVVLFGGCKPGSTVTFDTQRLHYDQITLRSPFHLTRTSVRQAYNLLAEGQLTARPLITDSYPLDKLDQVFSLLQKGDCIKYAVIP